MEREIHSIGEVVEKNGVKYVYRGAGKWEPVDDLLAKRFSTDQGDELLISGKIYKQPAGGMGYYDRNHPGNGVA